MSWNDFTLTINGTDLATLDVGVVAFPKHWESPSQSFDRAAMPLRRGMRRTSNRPTVDGLPFQIDFEINAADETTFDADCDAIRYLFSFDPLTIIGGNHLDRQRSGVLEGAVKIGPKMMTADGLVSATCSVTLYCDDPAWYQTTLTTESASANTDHACPLGTLLVWPITRATVSGTPASITFTYKNHAGTTIGTPLVLAKAAGNFANADVVEVDHNLMTITLNGTRKDSLKTGGDFFALDPRDGNWTAAQWPSVRCTQALDVIYRAAY